MKTLVALLVPGFEFYCMSRRRFISPVALASHLQSIRCLSISRWLVSRTRAYRNGGTRIGLGLQIYTSLVDGCKRAYAYVTATHHVLIWLGPAEASSWAEDMFGFGETQSTASG